MDNYYSWFKVLHIFAVISWMAGLLYLPRIYVYHTKVMAGSEADKIFQIMEYRLLRIIMTPAMLATYIFGLINTHIYGFAVLGMWFHIKMVAVLGLSVIHGLLAKWRKDFVNGNNKHSEKFYRIINEVPALLMLIAIIMVVVKPFE